MPNLTTQTTIVNRALQIVGYKSVSSIQQVGDRGAKAMETAWTPVLLSELQKNFWAFSIKRATLAASATPPVHTKTNAFPFPPDYIMLAPEDQYGDFPLKNDWIVEGTSIITDDSGPLYIRYVSSSITPDMFDAIFAEAYAAALAVATSEQLNQSNSKLQSAAAIYETQISLARRRGAILNPKQRLPVSPWISKRG